MPQPFAASDLRVRRAAFGDLPTIVEFNRRLALETEGKTLDPAVLQRGVARALEEPDRLRYWLIERADDQRILGQAGATREWTDWRDGWIWWLQSVYVDAEHRGRGVFRALYQHIRTLAAADPDVIGLRLYVENENERARRTYLSVGMRPGGYSVLEELWLDRPRPSAAHQLGSSG